jgi:hypothetical protein
MAGRPAFSASVGGGDGGWWLVLRRTATKRNSGIGGSNAAMPLEERRDDLRGRVCNLMNERLSILRWQESRAALRVLVNQSFRWS